MKTPNIDTIRTEENGIINTNHIVRIYTNCEHLSETNRQVFTVTADLDVKINLAGEFSDSIRLFTLYCGRETYNYVNFTVGIVTEEWFEKFCKYVEDRLEIIGDYSVAFEQYEKTYPLKYVEMSNEQIEAYIRRNQA